MTQQALERETIETKGAPAAIGTYSQAVRAGNTVYISGQIPIDPNTQNLLEADFQAKVTLVFKNLKAICEAAGGSLQNIAKLSIFLTDLNNFSQVNEIMQTFFEKPYPARAVVEVSALPKGVEVEMDAVMIRACK